MGDYQGLPPPEPREDVALWIVFGLVAAALACFWCGFNQ
jgi:hypothetical protein